jgi:2,4-dienoyl-CoA reductase-like NADH-dependent reductase (Old Yellow Enzyme family)
MPSELFSPLRLRSGLILGNRIAKAAMEEGMAGDGQLPDQRMLSLYRRWGAGGAGLLITGQRHGPRRGADRPRRRRA